MASASSWVVISGIPSWLDPALVAVAVIVAIGLTIMVVRGGAHGVLRAKGIAVAWGLSALMCFLVIVFTGVIMGSVNESRIEGHYGVSDISDIKRDRSSNDYGERRASANRVLPVPAPDGVSGPIAVVDGDVIASSGASAHHVSFEDAKGVSRDGYIVVSGPHAGLYVSGSGDGSGSGATAVSEYSKSSSKGGTPDAGAYDYGRGHGSGR